MRETPTEFMKRYAAAGPDLPARRWLAESDSVAACVYDFSWTGLMGGTPAAGSGRGTSVIVRTTDSWRVVHEHRSTGRST